MDTEEKVCTFLGFMANDSQTIFSMKLEGTKCKSTDFFNRLDNKRTLIYLKNTAISFSGFLVHAEYKKFNNVNGVFTIFS